MLYYIAMWSALVIIGIFTKKYIDEVKLDSWIEGFGAGMDAQIKTINKIDEVQRMLER